MPEQPVLGTGRGIDTGTDAVVVVVAADMGGKPLVLLPMSENEKDATSLKAIERERGKASVKALEQLLAPAASSMSYIDDDYILTYLSGELAVIQRQI